jgi:Peptidase family M1 domain
LSRFWLAAITLVAPATLLAQTVQTAADSGALPAHVVNEQTDDPFYTTNRIDWPGPNAARLSTGEPGPGYWQQRADYTIAATLDTGAKTITGTVTVHYTNNSPDTLHFVWMQADQNLYRPGSGGSSLFPADSRWGVRGFAGGYTFGSVTVNGRAVTPRVNDTMMRLDLPTALVPHGGTATIAIQYSFPIPEHGSDRMGRDGTLYELAQWYPRMAVYDDVRGWNVDQYLGQGEFYLEYGNIDYAVTVPAGYTVAGSGLLQNAPQVLTSTERSRLAKAAATESVVPIITDAEAKATPTPGTKTWRFRAEHVRDVAWAAAPDFRWDATSWHGVLCQAYYQIAKAHKAWESAAEQTQWTIRQYSQLVYPFPYPQATSVAGPVGGMEYPMFVMVHYGTEDAKSIFGTINHEHGHEWFPMIVGSNERRYAWMDEGFNTYINAFANEARYPGTPVWASYLKSWAGTVDNNTQTPLMAMPDHIPASALGAIGYRKPGAVLLALRDNVVGRETMDRAIQIYVRRWAYKHPTPGDFFRTIENVSGQDLSWFWRGFFYSTDVLDIGIDSVTSDGSTATIALTKHTSILFPVSIRLALKDGTTQDVHAPVDLWSRGDEVTLSVPVRAAVTGARLWPDPYVPDWNAKNDTWGSPPPAEGTTSSTSGGLNPSAVQ